MSSRYMNSMVVVTQSSPQKPILHDFEMQYATIEAREASFAPPTKRSKAGWPHKTPTPADLAKAGFFYSPSTSKDNVECFTCGRHLDGWEEDDDALQEHIKHSPDCAWAMLMRIEVETEYDASNMEDPTGESLTEARRTTFTTIGWPHESKRSWICKTEKMVEGGWHFAPSPESEDYVSCVYCKLSLDGWEPKDNPFEEHYRRSPQCQFFVFAGTTAPSKRPKAKKGRASRASRSSKASSRLSTQSNMSMLSEAESIPDLDQSIDGSADNSQISIKSTISTATTKGKRKASTRTKTTKAKKAKTTKSKEMQREAEPEEQEATQETERDQSQQQSIQPSVSPSQEKDRFERFETPAERFESNDYLQAKDVTSPERAAIDDDLLVGPPQLQEPTIPVQTESPLRHQQQRKSSLTSRTPKQSSARQSQQRGISKNARTSSSPSQSPQNASDTENAPPSSLPSSARPPLSSPGAPQPQWTPVDVDLVFMSTPVAELFKVQQGKEGEAAQLSIKEQEMTVQEWIEYVAGQAEEDLKMEGERVVAIFEKEGQRALSVLEGIACE